MRTLIALMTLIAVSLPMSAFAQNQDMDLETAAITSSVVGTLTGLFVGGTAGVVVGNEVGSHACDGGLDCIGSTVIGMGVGALVGSTVIGTWSGVATYGALRPSEGSGHLLSGSLLGGAAGLGLATAMYWQQPSSTQRTWMMGSITVLGMGVGGLIGAGIPNAPSVALIPTDGGATAHIGFQF